MFNHEPPGYDCPFCQILRGVCDERNAAQDTLWRGELAFARLAPKWWPANHGSALVIPVAHVENLYDTPDEVGHALWDLTRRVATAMRVAYRCEGVSTRQHNEPAGSQDVWHLHVHVLPRRTGDRLYQRHGGGEYVPPARRAPWAALLRQALASLR